MAILGAVGATRRQVSGPSWPAVVVLAVPALLAGSPGGAWMFRAAVGITDPSDGPDVATLPSSWVLVLAPAVVAMISALAAGEARRVTVPVVQRAK